MASFPDSILTFDLGASALRAALVPADGVLSARFGVAHRTGAEAEPEAWWRAAVECMAGLDAAELRSVRAVCLTGMTRTQVVTDRTGAALRPAITFADVRAAELVRAHPEAAGLNAYHPVARLLWVARHEPGVMEAAEAVIDPKDYLAARLTGRVCTDPISAAPLLAAAHLLAPLGLPTCIVPELLPPGATIGAVRRGLPGAFADLAGVPVIMAAHDTWTCVLGMGALEDGAAYNLSGTTEIFGLLTRRPAQADGLLTVDWGGGLHQLGGPSNAGGATIAWLASLLRPGEPIGTALDAALTEARHPQPALFLPYLEGERVPHWDPQLRGALLGLHAAHGPADLLWAGLEGVACLNRLVLERAEAAADPVAAIRFGGGGAASAVWAQVKADMLDRPVVTTTEPEAGLLGAGITAAVALGVAGSLANGQKAMVHTRGTFEPNPDRRAFCDALYAAYRQAEAAVAPISRTLAQFNSAQLG